MVSRGQGDADRGRLAAEDVCLASWACGMRGRLHFLVSFFLCFFQSCLFVYFLSFLSSLTLFSFFVAFLGWCWFSPWQGCTAADCDDGDQAASAIAVNLAVVVASCCLDRVFALGSLLRLCLCCLLKSTTFGRYLVSLIRDSQE